MAQVVTGKVKATNDDEFTLFLVSEQREIRCRSELPIRTGDILSGIAEEGEDGTFYFQSGPLVEIGKDRDTVVDNIASALRCNPKRATEIYDRMALSSSTSLVSDIIAYIAEVRGLTISGLNKKRSDILLRWWHKNQTLRQIHLLGLREEDISRCTEHLDEVASMCFRDPYRILGISMDNADKLASLTGAVFSPEHIFRAKIARKVFYNLTSLGWTGTPTTTITRTFGDIDKHIDSMEEYWSLVEDSGRYYMRYPLAVEKEVASRIAAMVKQGESVVEDITANDEDLTKEQRRAVHGALSNRVSVITGPPGTGKCLDPLTPVMMFSGEVRSAFMVRPGDKLMGPDSRPRTVVSITQGQDSMYLVKPEHGDPFVCNAPHVLTLRGMEPKVFETAVGWIVIYTTEGYVHVRNFEKGFEARMFAASNDDVYDIPLERYLECLPVGYLFRPGCSFQEPPADYSGDVPLRARFGSFLERAAYIYSSGRYEKDDPNIREIAAIAGSIGLSTNFYDIGDGLVQTSFHRGDRIPFDVFSLGVGPYFGFELSGDGRFLLGDGLVTHNTRVIREITSHLKEKGEKYLVCSFTGKAVARLKAVLGERHPKTIHRIIARGSIYQPSHVIVDEASTVTTELLYTLGQKIGWDYRLTLVGDENQLQPIGWGSLFSEVIASGKVPIFHLEENHRSVFGVDGIVPNCRNMVAAAASSRRFVFQEYDNFHVMPVESVDEVMELVKVLHDGGTPADDIAIITPYNKYIGDLNSRFQRIYNSGKKSQRHRGTLWCVGDRVMYNQNDYHRNIMNGEEGKVVDVSPEGVEVMFDEQRFWLLFNERGEDGIGMVCLSFAATGYRHQGSENEIIIGYIPKDDANYRFLDWKFLNTVISRGRLGVWLLGDVRQILEAANRPPKERMNSLADRIKRA